MHFYLDDVIFASIRLEVRDVTGREASEARKC